MVNPAQNPNQKLPGNDVANQGPKSQNNPSPAAQDKNSDRNAPQQQQQQKDAIKLSDGSKNDPKSSDTRREREEEDRPRADNKSGNK
jgi:hypothetical protein